MTQADRFRRLKRRDKIRFCRFVCSLCTLTILVTLARSSRQRVGHGWGMNSAVIPEDTVREFVTAGVEANGSMSTGHSEQPEGQKAAGWS